MLGGKISPPKRNLTWTFEAESNKNASEGLMAFNNCEGFPLLDGLFALKELAFGLFTCFWKKWCLGNIYKSFDWYEISKDLKYVINS